MDTFFFRAVPADNSWKSLTNWACHGLSENSLSSTLMRWWLLSMAKCFERWCFLKGWNRWNHLFTHLQRFDNPRNNCPEIVIILGENICPVYSQFAGENYDSESPCWPMLYSSEIGILDKRMWICWIFLSRENPYSTRIPTLECASQLGSMQFIYNML